MPIYTYICAYWFYLSILNPVFACPSDAVGFCLLYRIFNCLFFSIAMQFGFFFHSFVLLLLKIKNLPQFMALFVCNAFCLDEYITKFSGCFICVHSWTWRCAAFHLKCWIWLVFFVVFGCLFNAIFAML